MARLLSPRSYHRPYRGRVESLLGSVFHLLARHPYWMTCSVNVGSGMKARVPYGPPTRAGFTDLPQTLTAGLTAGLIGMPDLLRRLTAGLLPT